MTPPLPFDPTQGIDHLKRNDPILKEVIARVGPCSVIAAPRVDLFASLLRSIIYQQLHGKAAATIHGRVLALLPKRQLNPLGLASIPDQALRGAGLSSNKLLALRDLAAKTREGIVPTARVLTKMEDAEILLRLTSIRGIGPWTVQMLLIFTLGRTDVLPTGDFAIRKAFSLLYRRGRAVKPESMIRHAKKWQPYRSIASWYLWRFLDLPPIETKSGK